jgi:hypothetical protein
MLDVPCLSIVEFSLEGSYPDRSVSCFRLLVRSNIDSWTNENVLRGQDSMI